jgi:tRNA-intron endonuclease
MSTSGQEKLKIEVRIHGLRGIVPDIDKSIQLFKAFIGKPLGVSKPDPNAVYRLPLVLSPYETLYLCEKGLIEPILNGQVIDCKTLQKHFESLIPDFAKKYAVFADLTQKGYILRDAMKYGADFAVYELGPGLEHAPYVVTVASSNTRLRAIDIVGLGRLSHSVRKKSVLAIVDDKGIVGYIVFKWVKT